MTCSHSLNLVVEAWHESLDQNDALKLEFVKLKADNNRLQEEINQFKVNKGVMAEHLVKMQ